MKKEVIRKTDTCKRLRDALSSLLLEKDINSINTTELCKIAGLNRSTFYANYYDQYDLYDDLKSDLVEQCKSSLSNAFINEYAVKEFLLLIKGSKLLQALLEKTTDVSFLNEIKDYERNQIDNHMSYQMNKNDYEYIFDFILDGSFAIIVRWIKNGCVRNIDEIGNLITNIIKNMNFYFERQN